MVKDYVKPPAQNVRAMVRKSKFKRFFILFIIIFIAIALPSGFFIARLLRSHKSPSTITAATVPTDSIRKKTTSMQFDFYNLLPKMTIEVAESNNPTPAGPLPISVNLDKTGYALQIASLQKQADANRLQQQLHHMGFRCFIQHFQQQNGVIWYRVLVGPYVTRDHAKDAQNQLAHQSLSSLILKLPS